MDDNRIARKEQSQLMTAQELAKYLKVSERTLWELTTPRGTIPAVRIKRSVRYVPEAIERWLASQMAPIEDRAAEQCEQ